jgi:FkbM family methyltransferase
MVWQGPIDGSDWRLACLWPKVNSGAQLADLIRLDVIFKFGGVYLDSDVSVCRSLNPIADNCNFFVCSEDGNLATNAVFGASKGHDAVDALIGDLLSFPPDWSIPPNETTGPVFFARILKWRTDISVLPRATFYPFNWNESPIGPLPATYGVHQWAGSWGASKPFHVRLKESLRRLHPRVLSVRGIGCLERKVNASERMTRLLSKRIRGFNASEELVRRTIHGCSIVLSGRDVSITPALYMNGYYELREELFVRRCLQGGDYFVDVGANVGVFSLLAASKVGPFGRVFAFEPNQNVADLLRKSARMNWMHERIVIRQVGVGARSGTAMLSVNPTCLGDATMMSGDTGGAFDRTRRVMGNIASIPVEVVSLDTEFPYDLHIRIVKIDAGGFEAEVLEGAARLLRNSCIDYVILEMVEEVAGSAWHKMISALEKLENVGYYPHIFLRDGAIERTTLGKVRSAGGQGARNIVMKREGAH